MPRKYEYVTDENQQSETSSRAGKKIGFLLIGGGVGAALALLLAPKSGRELRDDIADATRKGYDKSRETANQLREQSGMRYQQLKGQASDVYNRAGTSVGAAANKLRRSAKNQDLNALSNSHSELTDDIRLEIETSGENSNRSTPLV